MAQTSILGRIEPARPRQRATRSSTRRKTRRRCSTSSIRDFTNNIAEAEEAVAQTIGNLRLLEDDVQEAREAAGEWG